MLPCVIPILLFHLIPPIHRNGISPSNRLTSCLVSVSAESRQNPAIVRQSLLSDNGWMVVVDKELACSLFELFDAGKTSYAVAEDGASTLRTAQRVKSAYQGFHEGKPIPDICRATKWKKGMVNRLFGWWEEYQGANNAGVVTDSPVSQDPVMVKARIRHFRQLTDLAERLNDTLEDESEEIGQNAWRVSEWLPFELVIMKEGLKVSLRLEDEPLFPGLRNHLRGESELWNAFEDLKCDLVDYCRATQDVSRGGIRHTGIADIPDSWYKFSELLDLVLIKGIATGKCDLCPDA